MVFPRPSKMASKPQAEAGLCQAEKEMVSWIWIQCFTAFPQKGFRNGAASAEPLKRLQEHMCHWEGMLVYPDPFLSPVPLLIWHSVNQEHELASKAQAATSTWLWHRGSEGCPGKSNPGRLWRREGADAGCLCECNHCWFVFWAPLTVLHLQILLTS